MGPGWTSP